MRVYVGQTGSRVLTRQLAAAGIGECPVRGEPARRQPWFYDNNGAYSDYQHGRDFNVTQYVRDLRRIARWPIRRPDFIVLPDIVAGGAASLAESQAWLDWTATDGAALSHACAKSWRTWREEPA
jgi:hypothetical protein